jgi:hypothetical protein
MSRIRIFRGAPTACAVGFVLAIAGCSRSGLRSVGVDGGSSSAGPEVSPDRPVEVVYESGPEGGPESRPEPGSEVGPESGPESGPEPGREVGPESGLEIGLEAARETPSQEGPDHPALPPQEGPDGPVFLPETSWETESESGSEARSSTCPGAVKVAETLADLGAEALPSALAVRGDRVFVGVMNQAASLDPPTGAIVAVSLSTGEKTSFSLGRHLPNQIFANSTAIFFIQGNVEQTSDGWSFAYPDVARLDLATGQVSIVDSALVDSALPIWSLIGNDSGVFWSMLTDINGASIIKRWDEAARTTQTVLSWDKTLPLLIDRDHFYWSELGSGLHTLFMSMPIPSGPISQIYQSPEVFPDAPTLSAVDDQSLYYVAPASASAGIMAMPKNGGDSLKVVAGAQPILFGSQTIDDNDVYWVDQSDQSSIRRAPKTGGGTVETFSTNPSDAVSNLTVDGCNVYWTLGVPSRLLVKGK